MSHIFTFVVTLIMMTGVCVYTGYSNNRRGKGMKEVWMCVASTFLILVDPTRNLLADAGIWPEPGSDMYSCDAETYDCLTLVGALTIFFTYLGFTLLALGTIMGAELGHKFVIIRHKWRSLRSGGRKRVAVPNEDQDEDAVTEQSEETDRLLGASDSV